ncbi:MAG TPA: hypothetical protein VJ526_01790, partial [Beijerinckiaceae bacterium]|nr:hypothetical protein [Beijerinckiaceae bacterium]
SPFLTGKLLGAGNLAFFPLYPLAVRMAGLVLPSGPVAGIAVSTFCLMLASVLLYRITQARYGQDAAMWAVAVISDRPLATIYLIPLAESGPEVSQRPIHPGYPD